MRDRKRTVKTFVVEAIYSPNLKADTFQVSGLENLRGNELAEQFSRGIGEDIAYYPIPPLNLARYWNPWLMKKEQHE